MNIKRIIDRTDDPKKKIHWIASLAIVYWTNNKQVSDSLTAEEMKIANDAGDDSKQLKIEVYLDNADRHLRDATNISDNKKAISLSRLPLIWQKIKTSINRPLSELFCW